MLWEQYSPLYINDIVGPKIITQKLSKFVKSGRSLEEFPNALFVGSEVKHTTRIIRCFLASLFDEKVHQLKKIQHFTKNNSTGYNTNIYLSPYHVEINLDGLKFADRAVLVDIFNEYLSTRNISTNRSKILVFHEFNTLTKPAQLSLRRKMEECSGFVKMLLISKSSSNIDKAILSRCCLLRCPRMSQKEIYGTLEKLCLDENLLVDKPVIEKSIQLGNGDIKKSLIYLDTIRKHRDIDIINPTEELIKKLEDIITNKVFDKVAIDMIISKLMLSKLSPHSLFKYIIDTGCKQLRHPDSWFNLVQTICHLEYKHSQGANLMIILEKCLLDTFLLIRKDRERTKDFLVKSDTTSSTNTTSKTKNT
jgi:DNA polymerase III delta prime subunit